MDFDSWIVGFADGEGCFSIAINLHPEMKSGFQIQAEFAVTQAISNLEILEAIRSRFECGKIQLNARADNHHEDLAIYRVRRLEHLVAFVIPFFDANPLQTTKRKQYSLFREVVGMMVRREHLDPAKFQTILDIASRMNQRAKKSNRGILRDYTPGTRPDGSE